MGCVPFAWWSARRRQGFGPAAHVDAPRESGPLADDDAGSLNVAFESSGWKELDALGGTHVPDDVSRAGHGPGGPGGQDDAAEADPKGRRNRDAARHAPFHEDGRGPQQGARDARPRTE